MKIIITIFILLLGSIYRDSPQETIVQGCTDPEACNYNSNADEENDSCLFDDCLGVCGGDAVIDCTGICGGAYATDDCGECNHPVNQAYLWNSTCSGCMDESADNYDESAIFDDGSCIEEFPPGWLLVWNDEFNGETINGANWAHEVWSPGHVNNELQAYTSRPENSYIDNGHLVIQALHENYNDANYTSARLNSAGKGEIQYGRFDIRAKVPLGQGTWPAIWMLGSNIGSVGWPECGEIDIMEHVNNSNNILSSIHTSACYHSLPNYPDGCPDYNITCPDGCWQPNTSGTTLAQVDDWHVYGMIWNENSLTFSIDNQPFMTVNRPINSNTQSWPFDQDFFLILNLAIGGDWPGNPDNNIFPITFEIDYVRVYEAE